MDETPELGMRLGKLAVDRGLITLAQLREGLREQARETSSDQGSSLLGFILVTKGYLTEEQLQGLLDEQAGSGQNTLGKYRILRELGRGGMGVVHEAVDTELDRRVALKMILPSEARDAAGRARDEQRFLREARTSAHLPKHPGIVSVYEAGVIDGRRFIAMELVDGREMSAWRKERGASLRHQVALLREVALAVHEAHRKGIIHRDLKPANVLVDSGGMPHITDFGLAKVMRESVDVSLTLSGKVVGTPHYMSPEQGRGDKDIDGRTDVYSMGVMLYEILTNRLPFQGDSPLEILMKRAEADVVSPSSVARSWVQKTLGHSLDNICMKAMAKDPRERYRSAKAFAADLTAWIEGEEVKAQGLPRHRGRRALALVGTTAGLLLLALGAVALSRPSETADRGDLDRAERLMNEGNYGEALEIYVRKSLLDGTDARARAGKDRAQAKIRELIAASRPAPLAPVSPFQEGESLKVLACTAGKTSVQATVGPGWEGQWSGNAQLLWTGGNPNSKLRLQFRSPVKGRVLLYLGLTLAPDYGLFRVCVNGKVIDPELSLYSPKIRHFDREFRGIEVASGDNELEVEIIGVHRDAKPADDGSEVMNFGLDYLRVSVPASADISR